MRQHTLWVPGLHLHRQASLASAQEPALRQICQTHLTCHVVEL